MGGGGGHRALRAVGRAQPRTTLKPFRRRRLVYFMSASPFQINAKRARMTSTSAPRHGRAAADGRAQRHRARPRLDPVQRHHRVRADRVGQVGSLSLPESHAVKIIRPSSPGQLSCTRTDHNGGLHEGSCVRVLRESEQALRSPAVQRSDTCVDKQVRADAEVLSGSEKQHMCR